MSEAGPGAPELPCAFWGHFRKVRQGLSGGERFGSPSGGGRPPPPRLGCPEGQLRGGGALTVMAAPRGDGSCRPEGGVGSRTGLRGAAVPQPLPLSAPSRRSSSPWLPRRCPGPFHPPIKLFFFQTSWEDPDEPMGGGKAKTNSRGGRGGPIRRSDGPGGGAYRDGTGALGGPGARREARAAAAGRAGSGRAGRKEGPCAQVTPAGGGEAGRSRALEPSDGREGFGRPSLMGTWAKQAVTTTQTRKGGGLGLV